MNVPAEFRVPVTRAMLEQLIDGKEVGFTKSGQSIILSPAFGETKCEVELQEVQDGESTNDAVD